MLNPPYLEYYYRLLESSFWVFVLLLTVATLLFLTTILICIRVYRRLNRSKCP